MKVRAFDLYEQAFGYLKQNIGFFVMLSLLLTVVSLPGLYYDLEHSSAPESQLQASQDQNLTTDYPVTTPEKPSWPLFDMKYMAVIAVTMLIGLFGYLVSIFSAYRITNGEKAKFDESLSSVLRSKFLKFIGLSILLFCTMLLPLAFIGLLAGAILFLLTILGINSIFLSIIIGAIAACFLTAMFVYFLVKLQFAQLFLVIKNDTVLKSIKHSFSSTKQIFWGVFRMVALYIIILVGIALLLWGLGILLASSAAITPLTYGIINGLLTSFLNCLVGVWYYIAVCLLFKQIVEPVYAGQNLEYTASI